jgi:hypothetical protein
LKKLKLKFTKKKNKNKKRKATPSQWGWPNHPLPASFFFFKINLHFYEDGHVSPSYWRHVALTCRANRFRENSERKINPESKT